MMKVLRWAAVAIATAAATAAVASSASSQMDPDYNEAQSVVSALLADSAVTLNDSSAYEGARTLRVRLPGPAPAGTVGGDGPVPSLEQAQLGWRASMAAARVASRSSRIANWELVDADGEVPAEAANFWRGVLRGDPSESLSSAHPKLGGVALEDAQAQLEANVDVLRRGLPEGSLRSTTVEVLRLPGSPRAYGLALSVEVVDLEDVRDYLGDVLLGTATGLAGDFDAIVEGFGVTVTDTKNRYIGGWSTTRSGVGSLVADPTIGVPSRFPVTLPFESLTGGPQPHSGAMGAAASTRPKAVFAAAGDRVTMRAQFVACEDGSGCPGAIVADPPCLRNRSARRLRIKTFRAAHRVRVDLFGKRRTRSGKIKLLRRSSATPIGPGARRWRTRIPAWARHARAQVEVRYVAGPAAVFVFDLAGMRSCR